MDNAGYQDLPLGYVLLAFTGDYDNSREYSMFEHVSLPDGKSYVYINETPGSGNPPPNDTYWMMFSNVGDLTELKAQLSAAILKANSLSQTLTAAIDARLAALTEAGAADLAEVVDARLGAASLRERISSLRAMWGYGVYNTGKIYTVKFNNTTMANIGTRADDAEGMTATASTDTARGQSDFDSVPIFRSVRCNGYVDSSGEFVITALEGEPAFAKDGTNGDVWTLFKTCWFRVSVGADEDVYSVSDEPHGDGWFPAPGAVRPDGTLRPFVPIASYKASTDENGMPVSVSGKCPNYGVSHNNQLTTMRKKGAQYCGMTGKDLSHLILLMEIEYASRNEKGSIAYGCLNYNFQYAAAVQETGVERVIITAAQASNIIVGSCVSIGNPTARSGSSYNIDRGQTGLNAKANRVLVTRKETLSDGNVAVYVDNGGVVFDTTTKPFTASGETYDAPTYISTMPWYTGSTDSVLGPTGSPGDRTSGKYDMRYRYVEGVWGNQYTILSDEVRKGDKVYVCDDCTKFSTALTADYKEVGYSLQFEKTGSWQYVSGVGFDPEHPSVMHATECKATSTTGYCCATYISADTTSLFAVWAGCNLSNGHSGGPRARTLNITVAATSWFGSSRLSATGRCGRAALAA